MPCQVTGNWFSAPNCFRSGMLSCLEFLLIVLCPVILKANETDTSIIEITKIRLFESLNDKAGFATAPYVFDESGIPGLKFHTGEAENYHPSVPDGFMEKTILLRFVLHNSADTARKIYFIPGIYCEDLSIYKANPENIKGTIYRMPDSIVASKRYSGCRILEMQPDENAVFFASFHFIRTNVNNFSARLIETDYLGPWLRSVREKDYLLDIATYLVSGIMLLMIFYSLAVYLQSRNLEFLFYSAYTFCTAILLFLKSFLTLEHSNFNFFYEEYFDFMILCTGVLFYLVFVRKFLDTKKEYPSLERTLKSGEILLVVFMFLFSMIYFLTDRYIILNIMENYIIKVFMLILGIIFIVYGIKMKNPLLNYLAAGNIALVFFSLLSFCILMFHWRIYPPDPGAIVNRSMLYYEIGLSLELILFLSGLAYKNRVELINQVREREQFKRESERKEFEKQMAVMAAQQEERNRISTDMHDELGSGVTAIRLMSEIVKSKMKQAALPEIEKISNSANELINKMNTIIWTMKSSNDTVESLAAYIRSYAIEYFDSTSISCSVNVDVKPDKQVSGEKRRNVFLSIKEALNNILKHANANRVWIDITEYDDRLVITIRDDGNGINLETLRRFGNGMTNMKRRMESIAGMFTVVNESGTKLTFAFPV